MEKNENGYRSTERFRNENGCRNTEEFRNENAYRTREGCRSEDGLQLGMVYSPYQNWRMLLSEEDALAHGTLFEELYKPLNEVCDD